MISYSTEMRRVGRAAQSLIDPNEMTRWVKSDHFGVLADVRYYPQSDRSSDRPSKR